MSLNSKKISHILIVETITSILPILVLMTLTYTYKGENGVEKLLDSYISITENVNLWTIIVLLILGATLWFLGYFYNVKSKYILHDISQVFLEMGINILRIGTGVLISFSLLYIIFNGFNKILLSFFLVGLCTLAESTFFSWFKTLIFKRNSKV